MNKKPTAHRAEFSVRCACGISYNTDDNHIGKQIRCRCGRVIAIARPQAEYAQPAPEATRPSATSSGSRRTSSRWSQEPRQKQAQTADAGRPKQTTGSLLHRWWASVQYDMRSRRLLRRWTSRSGWAWTALVLVTWPLLLFLSESFLPATLLAYGPRYVLLAPLVPLFFLALFFSRTTLIPLTIALWVTLSPIMGGRVSLHTFTKSWPVTRVENSVRVLTYNVQGGGVVATRIRDLVEQVRPDIVALQECGDQMWDSLQALPLPFHLRQHGLCTASRWKISAADSMPRAKFQAVSAYGFGGTGLVMRHVLDAPVGPLVFVNLHLTTARQGLGLLMGKDGFIPNDFGGDASSGSEQRAQRTDAIEVNALIRNQESELAALWSTRGPEGSPILVAGDFNLPVESSIFRRHWNDFTDAFEASGSGFGWSKIEGPLLRVRIDHVLVSPAASLKPAGAWVGPDLGSDHRPVIADFNVVQR